MKLMPMKKRWIGISAVVSCVILAAFILPFFPGSSRSQLESPYERIPILKRMELVSAPSKLRSKPFYIDRFEVTNQEFAEYLKETGYQSPEPFSFFQFKGKFNSHLQKPMHPVVNVTWFDAMAYAHWKGKTLPTLAQWFWAAIGPNNFRYPWGNEEVSEVLCNTLEAKFEETTVVGTFESGKSVFSSAYDLGGNVWEWTRTLGVRLGPRKESDEHSNIAFFGIGADAWKENRKVNTNRDLRSTVNALPDSAVVLGVVVLGGAFNTRFKTKPKEAPAFFIRKPKDPRCFKSPKAFDFAQGFRCVKEVDEDILRKLVEMLQAPDSRTREFSRENLMTIERMGIPFLLEAWLEGNAPAGELAEQLLDKMEKGYFASFKKVKGKGLKADQLEKMIQDWEAKNAWRILE